VHELPVQRSCQLLGVTDSGYYARKVRGPSPRAIEDARLVELIKRFHRRSRETYGARRIHLDLIDAGEPVGRGRVERLMRNAGIQGLTKRLRRRIRQLHDDGLHAMDRVARDWHPGKLNELWVADITQISTWQGTLYLAVVMDVCSRRIVGWAMDTNMRAELVISALEMAVAQRRPSSGLVHHSDHGSQYTSYAFGKKLRDAGILPSMGRVRTCYDNAVAESFFATLKKDLINRRSWPTLDELRSEIFEYIEGWYNTHRRHSSINGVSPVVYEARLLAQAG
jgi:putative transposase